jgi:hypothetical protein
MAQQQPIRGRSRPGKTPALTGRRANINLGGLFGGGGGLTGGPTETNEQDPATITDTPPDAEGNSFSTQSLTGGPSRMQYSPYTAAHPLLDFLSGGKASTQAAQLNERMQMQQMSSQDASDHLIQSEQLREQGDQKQSDLELNRAKESAMFNNDLQRRTEQDKQSETGQNILALPNSQNILSQEGRSATDDPRLIGSSADTLYGKTLGEGINQAQNASQTASSIADLIPALSRSGAMMKTQQNTLGADEAGARDSQLQQNPELFSDMLAAQEREPALKNAQTQATTNLTNTRESKPTKPTFQSLGAFGNGHAFLGTDANNNPQVHIIGPQVDPTTQLPTGGISHKILDLQTGMIKDFNATPQKQQDNGSGSGSGSDWDDLLTNPVGQNTNTPIQW